MTDYRLMLRDRLRLIVQETDTPLGQAFDVSIQVLVIISLISFSIDTLPSLTSDQRVMLSYVEWLTVILFSIEYVLRVWVAKRPLDYVLSFYGLVDLFAVIPFYISTSLDLRSLKIFRLLRLVRILKLAQFSSAISRFQKALKLAREEFLLFLFTTIMLLYLSSVGIYYFEHEAQPDVFSSVFHSMWWAVATLTTVGYGDAFPITVGGKIFTFLILMIGLGVVGIPAGLIASSLSAVRRNEEANDRQLK